MITNTKEVASLLTDAQLIVMRESLIKNNKKKHLYNKIYFELIRMRHFYMGI